MASAVLVTRNEANSFLTPTSMGKIPCRNPNPNFSNNHQFSRKHLINFHNGNGEGEGEELVNSFTASDDASSFNQQYNNPNKKVSLSHYVSYDISRYSRSELRVLKSRLLSELDRVRSLSSRIESGDLNRNVGSKKRSSPFQPPMIKEAKRGKQGAGVVDSYVASPQVMKMCEQVLSKMMKQKSGYVFNEPVDVVGMNLHDYHQIIKRPMDLGTIKKNLGVKGYYPTPEEFAADVRLTFNNALIYNPKGHEVHTLAERFLAKFEQCFQPVYQRSQLEKQQFLRHHHQRVEIRPNDDDDEVQGSSWSKNPSPEQPIIETPLKKPDPRSEPRVESLPPPPRVSEPVMVPTLAPVPVQAPVAEVVPVQTQEMVRTIGPGRGPSGKLPKPKAKDPNKREMSMEEKHKLGAGLQSLPQEKMSQVIHIIRKRNGHLTQEGDEIELDIEAVDIETLWELDRFVTNYKKMVSKIRRQALMQNNNVGHSDDPNQVGMSERMTETVKAVKRGGGDVGDEDVDIGDEMPVHNFPPVEIDKDDDRNQGGGGGSGRGGSSSSSSSGSSNSDSSSSSDSDSGSSSGSDPDVDDAQSRDNESKNIPH